MNFYDKNSIYFIFGEIVRLHYCKIQKQLDKLGLYPGQPPVLFILNKKDGQSQKDIANKMKIKPATITVMLKRMEKLDFVKRVHDDKDQRIIRVYLSKKGNEIIVELKKVLKDIENQCFENFTTEETIILRRLFLQIRDNLTEKS